MAETIAQLFFWLNLMVKTAVNATMANSFVHLAACEYTTFSSHSLCSEKIASLCSYCSCRVVGSVVSEIYRKKEMRWDENSQLNAHRFNVGHAEIVIWSFVNDLLWIGSNNPLYGTHGISHFIGIPFRIHVRRVFDVVRLVSTHYSHISVPFFHSTWYNAGAKGANFPYCYAGIAGNTDAMLSSWVNEPSDKGSQKQC